MQRNIITLAYGKAIYTRMAENLARSFLAHDQDDIAFHLATDAPSQISPKIAEKVHIIDLNKICLPLEKGFLAKLCIDHLVGFRPGEYLFVDSDCLIYGNTGIIFNIFKEKSFGVIGRLFSEGEWFGDLRRRCQENIVKSVPVFVGAVYYLRLDGTQSVVLESARNLAESYDRMGMVRLRNLENEEPLISLGMSLNNVEPNGDDKLEVKADAMFCDLKNSQANVLTGKIILKILPNAMITSPATTMIAHPCIFHFNDSYTRHWLYARDSLSLRILDLGLGRTLSRFFASFLCFPTFVIWPTLKSWGRPLYRKLFGYRQVTKNIRL